jgi:hypothetical protein
VAWNGTDLVTAAVGANGTLYAYEQVPGASSWQRRAIETLARNGGAALGTPSVTATATSVQVVSEDANGKIWFYQQADGQSTWSAPQLVAQVSVGQVVLAQQPKVAWTGVPGHTGTNSVITIANAAGDVLLARATQPAPPCALLIRPASRTRSADRHQRRATHRTPTHPAVVPKQYWHQPKVTRTQDDRAPTRP